MADDFDRIKRNVQTMIGKKAEKAKIVDYLAQEGLTQDEFKTVATGKAKLGDIRMTQKSQAAMTAPARPPMSKTDAGAAAFAQGALFDYGDELIGAIEAAKSGFEPGVYTKNRDSAREFIGEAEAAAPTGVKLAGNLTTGLPAAILTGGQSLPATMATSAGLGGIGGYGAAEGNDWNAVKQTLVGAGLGAAGGAAGYGLGKAIERLTSRGMAADIVLKGLSGSPDDLIREAQRTGMTPAELDDVLKEVVRTQAAKNPNAAAALVPQAQQRMTAANKQAIADIDRLISPDDASSLIKQLQQQGQAVGKAGYEGGAYANPATVGLVPDMVQNPAMADALKAAEKLAAAQGRPFDVTSLGIQDLDALQRALSTSSKRMFESTPENTLLGPVYDDLATGINDMAVSMAPELAETQAKYAGIKGAQEAVRLGQRALDPSKSFVEVAEEFAGLPADAQAAYRAGLSTRLRNLLQQKSPTSNAGAAINKEAVIEKLKAVGFPEEAIDAIIKRGAASRGVLDALQGGSDTARKLASAKASESPFSKVKPMDVVAGAVVHPSTVFALPFMRALGARQESKAAEMVLRGLASPQALRGLMARAPQRATPAIGLMSGIGASQIRLPQ